MSTSTRALDNPAQRAVSSIVRTIILVIVWGGLIAASRRYLDLSLGVPGHTGILWMALLVSGRLAVQRNGVGLGMGVAAALWGVPLGLGHSPLYNIALCSLVGAVVDLLGMLRSGLLRHPLGGIAAGGLAHLAKFGFITAYAASFGLYRNFWELGLAVSAGYHLLFGAIGGLIAVLAVGLARRRGVGGEH